MVKVVYCHYNPKKDIKKVSPTGALDLKAAFANNAIPSDLSADSGRYNGIDEPEGVTRPSDSIDAAILEKGYKAAVKAKKDAEQKTE